MTSNVIVFEDAAERRELRRNEVIRGRNAVQRCLCELKPHLALPGVSQVVSDLTAVWHRLKDME